MAENLTLLDTNKISTKSGGRWEKLAFEVIETCPKIKKEREKQILCDRFGIGKIARTLDAIGQSHGVTRERIRQIVNNAVRKIQKSCVSETVTAKITQIESFIKTSGGYVTRDDLNKKFAGEEKPEQNALKFIATLSKKIELLKETNVLRQGWNDASLKNSKIKAISTKIENTLAEENKALAASEIGKIIGEETQIIKCILTATKTVMEADDGKWGLVTWPHINPKSIKDKSKYVITRHGKPIHYAELTEKISSLGKRKVTKQSVHNELIKSAEFVLVGRGIYALSDWGYTPGVVEEVIFEVLENAGEPLHKNEIVKKVLEKRIVKVSTIILNLQKARFKRAGKGIYTLN